MKECGLAFSSQCSLVLIILPFIWCSQQMHLPEVHLLLMLMSLPSARELYCLSGTLPAAGWTGIPSLSLQAQSYR